MTITLLLPATETAPGLVLRPWRIDDVPVLVAAHRDPALRAMVDAPAYARG